MESSNSGKNVLSDLAHLGEMFLNSTDVDCLLDRIIDGAMHVVGCSHASLLLFEYRTHRLTKKRFRGFEGSKCADPRIELTENVGRWIYEGGEVLALAEENSHKFLVIFDEEERDRFRCELRLPFYVDGVLVGVLSLGQKDDGTDYSPGDIDLLRVVTSQAVMRLEKFLVRDSSGRKRQSEVKLRSNSLRSGVRVKKADDSVVLIGRSPAMQKVRDLIDRVAGKDVSVLITGESGTGKELVARAIHSQSNRRDKPMVTMNSAALPETLVESELFGHEKGAFTGAISRKPGKFEVADGSTLFLDEIGDMSAATQSKLLRVLEDGSFQRVGGSETLHVDVRLLAATNCDLNEEICAGRFREDLYYRINVVHIHVPPLRERREDIPTLANYFLKRLDGFYDKNLRGIEPGALERLTRYDFPGNVRELQNIIERAVILEKGSQLSLNLIPISASEGRTLVADEEELTLDELEKRYIEQVIKKADYNKSQASRVLGIARKTLREKMEKYGISRP